MPKIGGKQRVRTHFELSTSWRQVKDNRTLNVLVEICKTNRK